MTKDLVLSNRAIEPAQKPVEGEIVEDRCELGLPRCTNTHLKLTLDVYLSDVYGEKKMITVCPNCGEDNADAI